MATLKPFKEIPVFPGWPIIGAGPVLRRMGMLPFIKEGREKYGDLFRAETPLYPLLFVCDPAAIRHVLQENPKAYRKSPGYEVMQIFLGKGLLTNEGDDWLKQRRLAQPAFHKQKLQVLFRGMAEESAELAREWEALADSGKAFDLVDEMTKVAMRIVAKTLFGTAVDEDFQIVSDAITFLNGYTIRRVLNPLFSPPTWVPTPDNLRYKKHAKALDAVIYKIIGERRKSGESKADLLSMLMEARDENTGEGMSDIQLRDELMTLFLAGHETTANAMAWAFYLIAGHPETDQKLFDEWKVFPPGKILEFPEIAQLEFTRQVMDEAMRLYPPAWIIGRHSTAEDEIMGFHIPPKTVVLIPVYEVHRHPGLWKDPLTFRPERFAEEAAINLHKFAFFPFGGGPRICIGAGFAQMEMQALLTTLGRKFKMAIEPGQQIVPEPLITLRPKNGIFVRIKRR